MELIQQPKNGDCLDATATMYPSRLDVVEGSRRFSGPASTFYGYVLTGKARIRSSGLDLRGDAGVFFCVPGELEIEADGRAVVIERFGFRALPLAGVIERIGRLSYIDGCSDTILCPPPRQGDPVLNYLHFPRGIHQTVHTHPSIRLGIVARGQGLAYGPREAAHLGQGPTSEWQEQLTEGSVFLLHAHELHAFRTTESGKTMDVIAFHPESDWGPTDSGHPMFNRTYLAKPAT